MTWIKIPDEWIARDDLGAVSDTAIVVHLAGLSHLARTRLTTATPGVVSDRAARLLWAPTNGDVHDAIAELVASGLWQRHEAGYLIRDHDEHLEDADTIRKRRADDARLKQRSRRHNKGDHSLCDPKKCWALKGMSVPDSGAESPPESASPVPSRTVPSRTVPPGREERAGGTTASAPEGAPASALPQRKDKPPPWPKGLPRPGEPRFVLPISDPPEEDDDTCPDSP